MYSHTYVQYEYTQEEWEKSNALSLCWNCVCCVCLPLFIDDDVGGVASIVSVAAAVVAAAVVAAVVVSVCLPVSRNHAV